MHTFVIDENLPRSLAPALKELGFSVKDVREHGLRGHPDEDIYAFAQKERAVIISGDLGFGDMVRHPLGSHHGMVIVRLPNEMSAEKRNKEICSVVEDLKDTSLSGAVVIISPGKVRIRKKHEG